MEQKNNMKKIIFDEQNINGKIVDCTSEEIAEREQLATKVANEIQAEEDAKTANETLKTSAKAKLVAGTPLTEEEANTIVL